MTELKCSVLGCNKTAKNKDKYCSMHRARLYRTGKLTKTTYTEKIYNNSIITQGGCIEWQGFVNRNGYGRMRAYGKKELAHRVIYTECYGTIPEGMLICHKCDNPKCVNPKHLFLGTHKDNVRDCIKKGRFRSFKGMSHNMAKLTNLDVIQIRLKRYSTAKYTEYYNTTKTNIYYIQTERTWKHIAV